MLVATGTEQEANSYIAISSEDRISGQPVSSFTLRSLPQSKNIQYVEPISFDSILYIDNVTSVNNKFVVNGTTITLTPGFYSGGTFATELQTQLNAALGPIVFTVTDVTTMPNSSRFRIQATAPYTVDVVSARFARLSGIFVVTVPTVDQTFSYTLLTPSAYFDVVASQIHRGVPDDSSAGTVTGLLFRVQMGQIPFVLKDVVTLQQSTRKMIFFPQATEWPVVTWQLLDEWRTPLECQPNSVWWVILRNKYVQVQTNIGYH